MFFSAIYVLFMMFFSCCILEGLGLVKSCFQELPPHCLHQHCTLLMENEGFLLPLPLLLIISIIIRALISQDIGSKLTDAHKNDSHLADCGCGSDEFIRRSRSYISAGAAHKHVRLRSVE